MVDTCKTVFEKKHRFVDWMIATRPWSFSASVVPVAAVALWLVGRFGYGDIRDVETDARAQCRTLPMTMGRRGVRRVPNLMFGGL